jgi:hypothetical protein
VHRARRFLHAAEQTVLMATMMIVLSVIYGLPATRSIRPVLFAIVFGIAFLSIDLVRRARELMREGFGANDVRRAFELERQAHAEEMKQLFDERRTAHLLALASMATFDALIACNDAKYIYWLLRPTQADPAIKLAIGLPNFPSYPSNTACISAAESEIIGALIRSERDRPEVIERGYRIGDVDVEHAPALIVAPTAEKFHSGGNEDCPLRVDHEITRYTVRAADGVPRYASVGGDGNSPKAVALESGNQASVGIYRKRLYRSRNIGYPQPATSIVCRAKECRRGNGGARIERCP